VARLETQLANPEFVAGAPARVVDESRRRLQEARDQLEVLRGGKTGERTDAAG
jgi:valyl-tRNA synthetase